jgi:hypothetical protein
MDTEEIAPFNFDVAAELFPLRGKGGRTPIGYRRFETAAEAVRFAIEVLPGALLSGTHLEVQDERFDGVGIRRLYDRADFPLQRQTEPTARIVAR